MTTERPPQADYDYNATLEAIGEGRISEALSRIQGELAAHPSAACEKTFYQIGETYKYLVKFFIQGSRDDSRQKTLRDISSALWDLALDVKINSDRFRQGEMIFDAIRWCASQNLTLLESVNEYQLTLLKINGNSSPAATTLRERALQNVFRSAWASGSLRQDLDALTEILASEPAEDSFELHSMVTAGLWLSLLRIYDPTKLELLVRHYNSTEDQRLQARLLVSILTIANHHHAEIGSDQRILEAVRSIGESLVNYPKLRFSILELVKTLDTERVSAKFRDDIIPELTKRSSGIIDKIKRSGGDIFDITDIEDNPQWANALEESGLGKKLREFSEMQSDGADVMMQPFAQLKNFPFFNTVDNWFLPFSADRLELRSLHESECTPILKMLEMPGFFCDSDKYSLALSLSHVPAPQLKALGAQLEAGLSQMKEDMKSRALKSTAVAFDTEAISYIRNLYRFVKLFRRRGEFPDIFSSPFEFRNLPGFETVTSELEIRELVAEFYFRAQYYKEALPLFETMIEEKGNAPILYEKAGYCRQRLGQYDKALEWYRKRALLSSESQWLMRRMAYCLRNLGEYAEAADIYLRLLENDPENLNLILQAGHNLLKSGKKEDALSQYYKATYYAPQNIDALRSIVWVELLLNHTEKSRAYINKVEEASGSLNARDHINKGHSLLLDGDIKGAVEEYRKASEAEDAQEDLSATLVSDWADIGMSSVMAEDTKILLDYMSSPGFFS